jgi:hypothetical protein
MEQNVLDLKGHKEIYLIGDTHYGNICSRRNKFLEVVNRIKNDKDALWIGFGDWIEGITQSDPRYHPEEAASIAQQSKSMMTMLDQQWDTWEKDINPIISKAIGIHSGNHGGNVIKRYATNELRRFCNNNDIRYYGEGQAITEINVDDRNIKIQTMHGVGGGRLAGHPYNKIDGFSRIWADMDIVAAGHTHKLGVNVSIAPLEIKNGKIKQKVQYHVSTGSFLANYAEGIAGYGEKAAYRPLPLGYAKVIINDGKIFGVVVETL